MPAQEVPDDIVALLKAFRDVPAFAASVAVLAVFWRAHWLWSRRHGLEDMVSIVISWTLIFTMLIYVYPLKVVFGGMFYGLSDGRLGLRLVVDSFWQGRALFAVYAAGFSALALEILLLNLHAWRLRVPLRLNEREQRLTRSELTGWNIPFGVGLVSLGLALTLPPNRIAWSGWIYFSMIILLPLHRWRRRRQLKASRIINNQ